MRNIRLTTIAVAVIALLFSPVFVVNVVNADGASKEALRISSIAKAKQLGVVPFIMYKEGPDGDLKILGGSQLAIIKDIITYEDDSLISNAGVTSVDVSGPGWQRILKGGEYILVKGRKPVQNGKLD